MKYITVFCGASSGSRPEYTKAATTLGRVLAASGIGLIYGGASTGLMGVIADSILEHGGEAIGVIPQSLVEREVAHQHLTKLHVVQTMHERKALMAELGDAFITLPGGFGTIEELFEVVTWMQLGFHDKPIGILNVENYYGALIDWLGHCVTDGFIGDVFLKHLAVEERAEDLLDTLRQLEAPANLFEQRKMRGAA